MYATIDLETELIQNTLNQKFICAGCTDDGKSYFFFDNIKDLINFLLANPKIYYIHNLGYDYRFFIEELDRRKLSRNIILRESNCLKITVYDSKNNKYFEIRDSYAVIPVKLSKLTKNYSKKYFKKDINLESTLDYLQRFSEENKIDYKTIFREIDNQDNDIKELIKSLKYYLYYDVFGLSESLFNFKESLNLQQLNLTIANIARSEFNKTFDIKKIYTNSKFDSIIRKTYFGGIVEVFKPFIEKNSDKIYYYDFNSLYPSVMYYNEYPLGDLKRISNPHDYHKFFFAFIECEIPKNNYLSPLPYRANQKLYFPCGRITGWYNSVDIELLREFNIPYKIKKIYAYSKGDFIFTEFIDKFWNMKKNSGENKALYESSKLIMNSSYGKFGERLKRSKYYEYLSYFDFKNAQDISNSKNENPKDLTLWDKDGNCIDGTYKLEIEKEIVRPFTTCHIASFITSYARKKLLMTLKYIIDNDYEIYYCDTDSIVTDMKLNISDELGELKLEQELISGYFAKPKIYALENTKGEFIIKAKGLKNCSFNDVKNYVMHKKSIKNSDIRISKMKSIRAGNKGKTECYGIELNVNYIPDQFKREISIINNNSRLRDTIFINSIE